MGKLKKIGIGFGIGILGFFILIIAVALTINLEENETAELIQDSNLEAKTAIANPSVMYEVGEPVRINQLEYSITKVRVEDDFSGLGLVTGPKDQILTVTINVKNVGKDPQWELTDFRLTDSEDRRFSGYFVGSLYGDNPGVLQPGLEARSHRLAIFTIPFDLNLEYFLTVEDTIIPLGKGESFDLRKEVALELAMNENDPSICDLLDNNTDCIATYAKNIDEPEMCLKADNSMECMSILFSSYGGEVCNLLQTNEIEECKKKFLISTNFIFNIKKTCTGTANCYPNTHGISTENLLSWKTDEGALLVCHNYFQKFADWKYGLNFTRWEDVDVRNEYCINGIGAYLKDLSVCDMAGNWQNECYDKVALSEDWFTLDMCDGLNGGEISRCYAHVAARTGDFSICSKPFVKETYGEEHCIKKVKEHQKILDELKINQ